MPTEPEVRRTSAAVTWLLALVAALWAVLRVAPGTIPDVSQTAARSALWPQRDLGEFTEFVRTSPLGQIAYRIGGALGTWEYVLIHALAAMGAVALLAWWLARQVPAGRRGVAVRLVVLSPVVAVLVVFLGAYDPFTVIGMAALLFAWASGSRWAVVAAGVYLGFQHFEQGLVVVIVGAVAAYALRGRPGADRPTPAWAYLGLVVGKAALTLVLQMATGDGLSGRSSYLVWEWVRPALVSTVNFGPVLLLSLFAGLWALVVVGLLRLQLRQRLLMLLAFALCLVPMAVAADHTRIYVLCALVPLLMLTADVLRGGDVTGHELVLVEAMAWLVVPLFVWTSSDGTGYLQHTGVYDLWVMFGQQVDGWLG